MNDATQTHYLDLLDQAIEVSRQYLTEEADLEAALASLRQKVKEFFVTVPLVGKFSSGKSTLLNAYLGQPLLPTDLAPTTAVATELHPTSGAAYLEAWNLDGHRRRHEVSNFPRLQTQTLQRVAVYLPNPQLYRHPRLRLVDMPGFDATLEAHHRAIEWYWDLGDAFIVLLASDTPFDASIVTQIQCLSAQGKPVYLFVSKAGRRIPQELESIRQQLAQTLGCPAEAIGCLERDDPQSLAAFSNCLDDIEAHFGQYLQRRFGETVRRQVEAVIQRLEKRCRLAELDDGELQRQIATLEQQLEEQHQTLHHDLAQLKHELLDRVQPHLEARIGQILEQAEGRLINAAQGGDLPGTIHTVLQPIFQVELPQRVQEALQRFQVQVDTLNHQLPLDLHLPSLDPGISIPTLLWTRLLGALLKMIQDLPVIGQLADLLLEWLGGQSTSDPRGDLRHRIRTQVIPAARNQAGRIVHSIVLRIIDTQEKAWEARWRQLLQSVEQERQTLQAHYRRRRDHDRQRAQGYRRAIDGLRRSLRAAFPETVANSSTQSVVSDNH